MKISVLWKKLVSLSPKQQIRKRARQKKPLDMWTLGEVKAECQFRANFGSCETCPLLGRVCMVEIPSAFYLSDKTECTNSVSLPRLARIIGVQVGQVFRVVVGSRSVEFTIQQNGAVTSNERSNLETPYLLLYGINHPESIRMGHIWSKRKKNKKNKKKKKKKTKNKKRKSA